MIGGKGGLNIKDYPFSFSITVLIFPSILSQPDLSSVLVIALFGGMIGTVLTITDPFGLFVRWIYRRQPKKNVLKKLKKNKFLDAVIGKNYDAALKSPSVSYETDKIVGIFYFVVILGLTGYRLLFDSAFGDFLSLDSEQIRIAFLLISVIFVGVLLVMINNVRGVRKSVSHLHRILTVTVLFSASDFINLSIEGQRILSNKLENDANIINTVNDSIKKLQSKKDLTFKEFKINFDDIKLREYIITRQRLEYDKHKEKYINKIWDYFLVVDETAKRYEIKLEDAVLWYNNSRFISPAALDEPVNQLQSSVDTRDWHNAFLRTTRITDHLADFFIRKSF